MDYVFGEHIPEELLFNIAEYSGNIPEELSSEYIIREIDNIYPGYPWCYEFTHQMFLSTQPSKEYIDNVLYYMSVPQWLLHRFGDHTRLDEYIIPGSVSEQDPYGIIERKNMTKLIKQGAWGPYYLDLNIGMNEPQLVLPQGSTSSRSYQRIRSSLDPEILQQPTTFIRIDYRDRIYTDNYIPILPDDDKRISVRIPSRDSRCDLSTLTLIYPRIFPVVPTRSQVLDVIRRVNPQFNVNDAITRSVEWRGILQDRLRNNDPIFHLLFNSLVDYSIMGVRLNRSIFSIDWTEGQQELIDTIIQLLSDRFPGQFRVESGSTDLGIQRHPARFTSIVASRDSVHLRDYLAQLTTDLYSSIAEYFKYWIYINRPVPINI
uniref:Uncharacterized protein n=1 Tax=viral metagenome TaxID=1070528 RepID=A0A6C0BLE0_9ZZZZ